MTPTGTHSEPDAEPIEPAPSGLCVCMLASGSKGNCIHISSGTTNVLFDAGLSGVEIERRMKSRGLCPQSLDAIIVSHEHADHIHGVGVLSRRFRVPVYIAPDAEKAAANRLGSLHTVHPFDCGHGFAINDLVIHPFSVSHDAAAPAGFTIASGGRKIGLATDLGIATAMVKQHLKGCDMLVLETNHDPYMLETGPYPWPLKQRVKGRTGHLSNEAAKDLLMEVLHEQLAHVVLAHISETNNTPEKALSVVAERIDSRRLRFTTAHQHLCSEMIRLP